MSDWRGTPIILAEGFALDSAPLSVSPQSTCGTRSCRETSSRRGHDGAAVARPRHVRSRSTTPRPAPARMPVGLFAIVPRPPDRSGSRSLSRRDALRPLARAVCHAGCLPRKELYEAWEVARRARRLFRGGRVVDLGAGHGLLAQVMLVLDDSSPSALAVDKAIPRVERAPARGAGGGLAAPRRAACRSSRARSTVVELTPDDVVVSSHACGALTDSSSIAPPRARARVAVLPCCHDLAVNDAGAADGLGRCAAGDRHPPGADARSARLPDLDAGDSRGDHAEEPPAPGRAADRSAGGRIEPRDCASC